MKKSKLLLVFALLVCSVGQAFGQETSFDRERRFQATIVKDIMMCPSVDMVDAYVNLICLDFCYDKFGMEKNGTDEDYWKGKANEVFEQIKKKLEKLDEKIAKDKRIRADDAYEAAMLYSLGYEPICSLDYQKAMTYFKMAPQTTETNVAMVGRGYKINKDMKAAAAAMTFTKPTLKAENLATQFGVQKFYQTRCNQLSAEFMPQIKRAIRSKDYNTLITYIPYKIKDVDSVLSNIPIDINVPFERYISTRIEDVDDFSNRNIICYNGKGGRDILFKSRDYRAYNPSTESLSGIIDLAESSSDLKQLQVPLQTVFSDKNNITKELSPDGLVTLAHLVKMDGDAALLYASVFYSSNLKSWESDNNKSEKASFERVMKVLLKKYPNVCSWQGCPISISQEGELTINSDNYYEVFFKHWAPGVSLKK